MGKTADAGHAEPDIQQPVQGVDRAGETAFLIIIAWP